MKNLTEMIDLPDDFDNLLFMARKIYCTDKHIRDRVADIVCMAYVCGQASVCENKNVEIAKKMKSRYMKKNRRVEKGVKI